MPTADQYETHVIAIRDAANTVNTDGDTVGALTCTNGRKVVVRTFSGAFPIARMFQEIQANAPIPLRAPGGGSVADYAVLVFADANEVVTITRARK